MLGIIPLGVMILSLIRKRVLHGFAQCILFPKWARRNVYGAAHGVENILITMVKTL